MESGAAWVTEPEQRLDEIEDWGAILSEGSDDPDDDEQPNDGQTIEQVVDPDNPDAEIVESDQIDEEGPTSRRSPVTTRPPPGSSARSTSPCSTTTAIRTATCSS